MNIKAFTRKANPIPADKIQTCFFHVSLMFLYVPCVFPRFVYTCSLYVPFMSPCPPTQTHTPNIRPLSDNRRPLSDYIRPLSDHYLILFFIIENYQKCVFFLTCLPPGWRPLLTPGMGIGVLGGGIWDHLKTILGTF